MGLAGENGRQRDKTYSRDPNIDGKEDGYGFSSQWENLTIGIGTPNICRYIIILGWVN